MGFLTDHPHTAITDTIDRIVSSDQFTLEVELASLIQTIKSSKDYTYSNNQEEAARSIRKKLKYGNKLQQIRALELLNLFVSQGVKFFVMYNDSKLLDRLEVIALNSGTDSRGQHYNQLIVKKCVAYVLGWYEFARQQGQSRTYEGLLQLGKTVQRKYSLKRRNKSEARSRRNFMNDEADASVYSANPDVRYGIPQIDMQSEGPKIRLLISDSLATSVSLKNSLMMLPSGVRSTEDEEATAKFIQARAMRRKVLRYLQLVTEGEFLGSLIHANEELVEALTKYDKLGGDVDDDDEISLSDDDDEEEDNVSESSSAVSAVPETYDNNDPFGDQNRI